MEEQELDKAHFNISSGKCMSRRGQINPYAEYNAGLFTSGICTELSVRFTEQLACFALTSHIYIYGDHR